MNIPDNGRRHADRRSSAVEEHEPAAEDFEPPQDSGLCGRLLARPRYRWLASVLSGLLLFACFPELDLNWLVWVAGVPLIAAVVCEPSLVRAALLGFVAGAIFLAGSCYWIVYVVEHYGGLSLGLSTGVLGLLVAVFSVIFAAFGLIEAWVVRRSRWMALALAPFLWVALELARTYYFTGFPWNLLGYAVEPSGLRQLASVTAVYGLSFLALATSALLVSALLAPRTAWSLSVPVVWLVLLVATNWIYRPPVSPPELKDAYLIQPNVPLDERAGQWAPWRDPRPLMDLTKLSVDAACSGFSAATAATPGGLPDCSAPRTQSLASRPLVVWAENPAPFFFTQDPVFHAAMQSIAMHTGAYVVFNTITFAGPNNSMPHNAAIVLDPRAEEMLEYDKIHLVPFGEYVPSWAFPGKIRKIITGVSDFVPGTRIEAARTPDGALAVSICYEDIFPQLVRRLTPPGPGVMVNISDDAWYGNSSAAAEHLEISRCRAIENGRYLLRATNDGITAVIDPYGRVDEELPRHRQMVLPGHFNYVSRRTFYNAHGDVFAWLCVAVALGFIGLRIRQNP
ncbi:MAG TPA: apolipoprotein N-acyltransferase [Terriglobia bacterium]|nr:apolipoprotein N-acyltransferase [Terriglobia bacterium]